MSTAQPNDNRINLRLAVRIGVGALLLMAAVGCARHYGGLTLDAQVTRDFEAGLVKPDYRYYYAGRDTMPYAIMGVDRRYSVPSRYWIAFAPQPGQLRNMCGNVYGKHGYDPYGSHIRDAAGEIVGVWYSNVRFWRVTVDPEARTVEVLFPNPENDNHTGFANIDLSAW